VKRDGDGPFENLHSGGWWRIYMNSLHVLYGTGMRMGGLGVGPFAAAVWIVWTQGPDEQEFTWTGFFPTVNLSLPRSDYFGLQ